MATKVKTTHKPPPDVAISDGDPKNSLITPPPSKKLKQARLPFKVLPPKPLQSPTNKKRKASDSSCNSGLQKPPKTPKADENAAPKTAGTKDVEKAENEVSSSSEAENLQKTKHGETCTKKAVVGLMDKFVRSTQQLEVTTSGTVIDLVESDEEDNEAKGTVIETKDPTESADVKKKEESKADEKVSSAEITSADNTDASVDTEKETTEKTCVENENSSINESSNAKSTDVCDTFVLEDLTSQDTSADGDDLNSSKNDSKVEVDLDSELDNSVLSEAEDSATVTSPNQDKTKSPETTPSSVTATPTSSSGVSKVKAKTPKQVERENERLQKQAEKEKERLEKQKQRDSAKAEKEKQRKEEKERKEKERLEEKKQKDEEKQRQQEEKDREREEKKKQKEKEKEEKLKQKEGEKSKKQESMSEDQKKKEEQKQKEEEKKKKESSMFKSFFAKSKSNSSPKTSPTDTKGPFIVFEVKKDMRLAPMRRNSITEDAVSCLDENMSSQELNTLYLDELKHRKNPVGKSGATWPKLEEDDDIEIVDGTKQADSMRVKRLQFCENYRPAYYGTWRKQSKIINPRNPFKQDSTLLDYDVESDDEWEEEEPGESLSNSEGEDGDSDGGGGGDDDEEDDGFFVPHGYLSNDEVVDDTDEEDLDPERQKAKQQAEAKSWDAEMKRPKRCEALRPLCIGCYWEVEDVVRDPSWDLLEELRMVPLFATPINTMPCATKPQSPKEGKSADSGKARAKFQPVPEEAISDLIRLVHGNVWSIQKVVKEFREFWRRKSLGLPLVPSDIKTDKVETSSDKVMTNASELPAATSVTDEDVEMTPLDKTDKEESKAVVKPDSEVFAYSISKRQLDVKIRKLAEYAKRGEFKRRCWHVDGAVLEKYGHSDLPIPTQWQWLTRSNTSAYGRCHSVDKEISLVPPKSAGKRTPTGGTPGRSILDFTVRSASPVLVPPMPPPKIGTPSNGGKQEPSTPTTTIGTPKPVPIPATSDTPKGKSVKLTPSALFKHGKTSPFTSPLAHGSKKINHPPPTRTLKDCFLKSSCSTVAAPSAASNASKLKEPNIISVGTEDSGDCIIVSTEQAPVVPKPPPSVKPTSLQKMMGVSHSQTGAKKGVIEVSSTINNLHNKRKSTGERKPAHSLVDNDTLLVEVPVILETPMEIG